MRQFLHFGASPNVKLLPFVFALTMLTGCSQIFSSMDEVFNSQTETDYRKLVSANFKTAFKDYNTFNGVEISAPRMVDPALGRTSITCLRFEAQGRRRVYVFFIRNNAIIEARYDVQTDQCATQAYQPFNLSTGLEKPATAAPQNPLY